ncbi:hypothetical protein M422DRAFT_232015 [Sphaerobolus stellatus SS14]|uniref:Protein kinase domain-containing protein n=1 Tax=Sphaerobolus stellatus (strain SS14) TaxID=990650 RepID=A0A0C9UQN3_SPHS4|nr:hypothetical protein M422DRAFT_232015 [Sphaerobolus stellatus SS14]
MQSVGDSVLSEGIWESLGDPVLPESIQMQFAVENAQTEGTSIQSEKLQALTEALGVYVQVEGDQGQYQTDKPGDQVQTEINQVQSERDSQTPIEELGVQMQIEFDQGQIQADNTRSGGDQVQTDEVPVHSERVQLQIGIPWGQTDGFQIEVAQTESRIEDIRAQTEGNQVRTKEHWMKEIQERSKTDDLTDHAKLNGSEQFWANFQPWFESQGYMLRPRYRPGWLASWLRTDELGPAETEDWVASTSSKVMDAVRISDNSLVILKVIWMHEHPYEIELGRFLSSKNLASDPTNHCTPVLDVLHCTVYQNLAFMVMPLLRWFDNPSMKTVGEAVDFFQQIFEGLQFMHKHRVAHRNCTAENIYMDATAMYPKGFHPQMSYVLPTLGLPFAPHFLRTERPPKYYFIDYGISRRYDPQAGILWEPPIFCADLSPPELQAAVPYNPFPTDVYYIGDVVRIHFIRRYSNFDFMSELVDEMTHDTPSTRPTIDQVVDRMEAITRSLTMSQLRAGLIERNLAPNEKRAKIIADTFRQLRWMVRRLPPIPSHGESIQTIWTS